jgi:hypothetical protein
MLARPRAQEHVKGPPRSACPCVLHPSRASRANQTAEPLSYRQHCAPLGLQVSRAVRDALTLRAADFGITLEDVAITHLSFGTEFTKAVEMKQVGGRNQGRPCLNQPFLGSPRQGSAWGSGGAAPKRFSWGRAGQMGGAAACSASIWQGRRGLGRRWQAPVRRAFLANVLCPQAPSRATYTCPVRVPAPPA